MRRTYVYCDGQAIAKQAKACFGKAYDHANYDPILLAKYAVGLETGRELKGFFFYTGVHKVAVAPRLRGFWDNKLAAIKTRAEAEKSKGLEEYDVFSRELLYTEEEVLDKKTGSNVVKKIGREKGVDVRLALDAVRAAHIRKYDVLIIFSQDGDLTEVFFEVINIAKGQKRFVQIESAFPYAPYPINVKTNLRGIPRTVERRIEKIEYDRCLDPDTSKYWP